MWTFYNCGLGKSIRNISECEFPTLLLCGCLAMPRLALIITDLLPLFRSSQLRLLHWKPLICIGVKLALSADPHHRAHLASNSICSHRFVNWLLCFASLNWCLESLFHPLSDQNGKKNQLPIKWKSNLEGYWEWIGDLWFRTMCAGDDMTSAKMHPTRPPL